MTTTTHTQTALLVAAVDALNAQIAKSKKGGVEVPGIGAEVAPGIKLRDLKNWRKEFAAKQASASVPAAATVKPVAAPKTAAAVKPAAAKTAPVAVELKSGEIREAGVILVGRAKENVLRISKINDVRTVVTDKGTKIAAADLELNNRGNLRVKPELVEKYTAPAETPAPVAKAGTPKVTTSKKAAVEQEELPEESPAATTARTFPIRVLNIKHSTQLTGAEYDRNTSTLYVTLKDAAVWAYEGVKLSEVRAFEQAALPWKHFSAHITNDKKGHMVKNHKAAPVAEKAPAAKTVAVKPAASKAPAKAASKAPAPAAAISTTALRAEGFMDGRKHEAVDKINRVKGTDQRVVWTVSGKRVPLESIVLSKGKFRVMDLNELPSKTAKTAAQAPAAKGTENTRKNGKAQKLDFTAEKAPAKTPAKVVSEKPSRALVKEAGVRVIKGTKEKMVDVIRIVNRDTGLTAVTANKGALHYDLIVSFDGQPTYTGKITAEEFRAL